MKNVTAFRKLSLADMAALVSITAESLGVETIPDFDTKAKGVALASAFARENGLELEVEEDGELAFVFAAKPEPTDGVSEPALTGGDYEAVGLEDPAGEGDEPEPLSEGDDGSGVVSEEGSGTEDVDPEEGLGDVGSDEDAADEAVAAMPFVKLAKEDLPARGTPEREAYRKARRKAARLLRKARQAA